MTDAERTELARRRVIRVLKANTVCLARTLEQKISDAGPNPMRIDPHVLTPARNSLVNEGIVALKKVGGAPWYFLSRTPEEEVEKKLAVLVRLHTAMQKGDFSQRVGQALEIAVYRALKFEKAFRTLGAYPDLDNHDDTKLYRKEEPPSYVSGRAMIGEADFVLITKKGDLAAIEVKNVREWLYPDREEVHAIIAKALAIDAVPIIIARRMPFVTFKLLNPCGVIIHQTFNQRFPEADKALADKVRHKDLLGFHDIRTGNQPDGRMTKFVSESLPGLLDEARIKFDENKDLLEAFSSKAMGYVEFAARVRRRVSGTHEDHDWEEKLR